MSIKKSTITQKVIIKASPDEVYEAFMDPKKHTKFTGSKATGKSTIGSKFTAWDGYIKAKNLELEKGKRIVQQWITTDWPENYPPSKLELSLKKIDGQTELSLLHSNIPTDQKKELEQGWIDFYWEPLKSYFGKK